MPGESGSYTMPGSLVLTPCPSETAFGSDTITGAVSIETDDGSVLTLTVAEAGRYMNMVGIENGYEIVDGGPGSCLPASQCWPGRSRSPSRT